MKCGRKSARVTSLFTEVGERGTKVKRMKCNFCRKEVVKNGTRMAAHISKCISCPKSIRNSYVDDDKSIFDDSRSFIASSPTSCGSSQISESNEASTSGTKQGHLMDSFVDTLTDAQNVCLLQ